MRIRRMFSMEMRLTVMLAVQPSVNTMRALAMSVSGVTTGAPAVRIWSMSAWTMERMMSMSWIIRSSTTSTSVPRSLNTDSRCASMNSGWVSSGCMASTAGLNRSRWPTWRMRPRSRARAMRSSASARVVVMGFSTSTSRLASRQVRATSWCSTVGTTTLTASTRGSSSR